MIGKHYQESALSSFIFNLNCSRATYLYTLRIITTQVTMINLTLPREQGLKRACVRQRLFPNKSEPIFRSIVIALHYTRHLVTLSADYWYAGTGLQIIFLDKNSRTVDVDRTEMMYRTDHLTEMTTATFFRIYSNLHPALQ